MFVIFHQVQVNGAKLDIKCFLLSQRIGEDIAIDFGPGEEIVGIEILDASSHLDLSREHPEVTLENLIAA